MGYFIRPHILTKKWRKSKKKSKTKRAPPRFRGTAGRTSKQINKQALSSALSSIAETQLISARQTAMAPSQFSATNLADYQINLNLGHTNYGGFGYGPLKLFNTEVEDGNYYKYLKRNITTFQIKMTNFSNQSPDTVVNNQGPIQFRVLVLKPNSKYLTELPNPRTDLWITEDGSTTGWAVARTFTSLDVSQYLINKKKFNVLQDRKFILSPPTQVLSEENVPAAPGNVASAGLSSNQKYPNQKTIRHTTNVQKKTFYGKTLGTDVPPFNYADDTIVCVLAHALLPNQRANSWNMDLISTTTMTDM